MVLIELVFFCPFARLLEINDGHGRRGREAQVLGDEHGQRDDTGHHVVGHLVLDPRVRRKQQPAWMVERRQKIWKDSFGLEFTASQSWSSAPGTNLTIIAKCIIEDKKISRVSYLPCVINDKGQPEVLKHDARGQEVYDYMNEITIEAGLNAGYKWDGDEVIISAD